MSPLSDINDNITRTLLATWVLWIMEHGEGAYQDFDKELRNHLLIMADAELTEKTTKLPSSSQNSSHKQKVLVEWDDSNTRERFPPSSIVTK